MPPPDPPSRSARTPIVLGVAGGVGAGKSTVAAEFGRLGWRVFDADREAHECLERDAVRNRIRAEFGDGVFDGPRVDRRALARVVFQDAALLDALNRIVHPCVRERLERAICEVAGADTPGIVIDAPLLIEAGLAPRCDRIVFVDAPRRVRLERVRTRGWDATELERREKNQKPIDDKAALADYRVLNDGSAEALRAQVEALHGDILRHASNRHRDDSIPTSHGLRVAPGSPSASPGDREPDPPNDSPREDPSS